jgi:hypothetical protein
VFVVVHPQTYLSVRPQVGTANWNSTKTGTTSLRRYGMLNSVAVHNNGRSRQRVQDAELLKRSGVHKLVITDQEGNCLAFVLAWDSFEYDAETDTYVCVADSDGRELMTMFTAGEVKSAPGTNMYVVTAPDGLRGSRALQAL